SDRAGEPLRAAHARPDAELDFGLAELRAVCRDDEIGHHRQLAPAAEREAVDRRYPRLAGRDDAALPAGDEVFEVEIGGRLVGHLLYVRAGGEGLVAAPGEDEAALAGVGVVSAKSLD